MQNKLNTAVQVIASVLIGKEAVVKLAVASILARGHLLLEDLPGMGKTTLAHTLARVFDLEYRRVQFTSDLLPADIIGSAIFNQQEGGFTFHAGPIFTQLLLADEINRSTPKTQSALLEAMEERQVSAEGVTRHLPEPFFVIATQNPASQYGTFPLPESQLDRFLMRLSIGYPDQSTERQLLKQGDTRQHINRLNVGIDQATLQHLQQQCDQVTISDALVDYVQRLAQETREMDTIQMGLSPRGALALVQATKAWAFMEGRDFATPDDVQAVFEAVVAHRLLLRTEARHEHSVTQQILNSVDVLS